MIVAHGRTGEAKVLHLRPTRIIFPHGGIHLPLRIYIILGIRRNLIVILLLDILFHTNKEVIS